MSKQFEETGKAMKIDWEKRMVACTEMQGQMKERGRKVPALVLVGYCASVYGRVRFLKMIDYVVSRL